MGDPTITNVDIGSVVLGNDKYENGLVTFAGADTFVAGTILARDSVSLKFVLYAVGGVTNENGIPKAILTEELVAAGAGDEAARVAIKGDFNKQRLVIDADGDDSNLDNKVRDELRDYGLFPIDVQDLAELDNQ